MASYELKASEFGLGELRGTPKQVEWANTLRDRTINRIWNQGWHTNYNEDFAEDIRKLPLEAEWWIENRSKATGTSDTFAAARLFLGLEYSTPLGSNY
jgi:uncharacterized protein (DUF2235 family)